MEPIKPVRAVFWREVNEILQNSIIADQTPCFLQHEPSNTFDKNAVLIAVKATDILEMLGVQLLHPAELTGCGFVKVGYLRRDYWKGEEYATKEAYLTLLESQSTMEGFLYKDGCQTLFKTKERLDWELAQPRVYIAPTEPDDDIPF